mmetsp:Transcript_76907/g.124427  ORF Transcript_76907/g.124427 Transcript_76907/m.124427 type:complete len:243 (-) Transcript_76907:368-1096(-)
MICLRHERYARPRGVLLLWFAVHPGPFDRTWAIWRSRRLGVSRCDEGIWRQGFILREAARRSALNNQRRQRGQRSNPPQRRLPQQPCRAWPPGCILPQQLAHEAPDLVGVGLRRHRLWLALHNLDHQGGQTHGLEGRLQREHLVEDDAQRPEVGLGPVGPVVAHLRRQVTRRPDESQQHGPRVGKDPGYAKVPDFHCSIAGEKDILALEVPVDNVTSVEVSQSSPALKEDRKCLCLTEHLGS